MKKLFTIIIVLVLLAAGFFLWKGGHHAVFLAGSIEQWLDADNGDQSVTVQLQRPGFTAEDDTITPQVEQLSFSADTFWTEYADDRVLGLTAAGCTAYLHEGIVYMDTGKAYTLPDLSKYAPSLRRLTAGALLHGRITKSGGVYRITMNRPELELSISVTADPDIRSIHISAVMSDRSVLQVSLTPRDAQPHPIPQEVLDAMVLARMEPPMSLSEPLEVLLPALETLLPLEGDLRLGLECGILNLSETVVLRLSGQAAELERKGITAQLALPDKIAQAQPTALALLLLRNGTFTREGDTALFRLELPPELTDQLCAALVPQISDLGIGFGASQALLTIQGGSLSCVSMTAEGEVPFLITTIPVAFRAELQIR